MKNYLVFIVAVLAIGLTACRGGQNVPEPVDPDVPGATKIVVARIQVQPMGSRIFYMLYDDESGKAFVFPLLLAEGLEDAEPGKTYVYPGDMDKTYAYWMLSDYMTHALYTEASFKKTLKSEDKMHIYATAFDTNGDKWVLAYDEP